MSFCPSLVSILKKCILQMYFIMVSFKFQLIMPKICFHLLNAKLSFKVGSQNRNFMICIDVKCTKTLSHACKIKRPNQYIFSSHTIVFCLCINLNVNSVQWQLFKRSFRRCFFFTVTFHYWRTGKSYGSGKSAEKTQNLLLRKLTDKLLRIISLTSTQGIVIVVKFSEK